MSVGLKTFHFWFGLLTILVFLATGQVMYHAYDHLQGMADAPRMLYRSAHLYILFSGVIHVMVGGYSTPSARGRRMQWSISLLLVASTALLIAAFFVEPGLKDLSRPLTLPASILLLAAVALVGVLHWRREAGHRPARPDAERIRGRGAGTRGNGTRGNRKRRERTRPET